MIQTRQYRAPEAILGAQWNSCVDIWSLGCVAFELAVGDQLFEPKRASNGEFAKDDDHLAQSGSTPLRLAQVQRTESGRTKVMELVGDRGNFPSLFTAGKFIPDFYDDQGRLRRIRNLYYWGEFSPHHVAASSDLMEMVQV